MSRDLLTATHSTRAVDSVHSGILLFGYTLLLSLFMAAVMFLNG